MNKVTIKLTEPIVFGTDTIEELEVRKPRAGDLRGIKIADMSVDDMLLILSRCSAQTPAVIDKLSIPDFNAARKVINDFLSSGQPIGQNG